MPQYTARGSYKTAVIGGQIPKYSGTGSRERLARRLWLANQNTSQWNVLRRNLSALYSGLQEKTDQLACARNSQTRLPEMSAQKNTIEPEDIIIISETIPNSEQNLVYWAIWRTMILIEPFIRPHKHICDREQTSTAYLFIAMSLWRDTCTRQA